MCLYMSLIYFLYKLHRYTYFLRNSCKVCIKLFLGLFGEGLDKTELVLGKSNCFIKPFIPTEMIDIEKMTLLDNDDYILFFLNQYGINAKFNSVCPVLDKHREITFKKFNGSLIHHGEMFELARLFGKDAPFMTYVYQLNKYTRESLIENIAAKNKHSDLNDVSLRLFNNYDN